MTQATKELAILEHRRTSRNLAKAIFESDHPEQVVRTIPAQSLYLALKQNGLSSSIDLIEIATIDQCRLLLDFDCWNGDRFAEDNIWEWLGLTDANGDFQVLQKIVKAIDLKFIGILISRYVEVVTFDEPTDSPPSVGYYTPDRGHTWIHLKIPDSNRHFLLARLLALIFETSTELFYQLLSIPSVATEATLEEDAYTEKVKRLFGEGIPDMELANELHASFPRAAAKAALRDRKTVTLVENILPVEPLLYDRSILEPLSSILAAGIAGVEEELTLIMNAAIVRYRVDFYELDPLARLTSNVKGAINIGIEAALELSSDKTALDVVRQLGLRPIYRLGLTELGELRTAAKKISDEAIQRHPASSIAFSVIAGARELLPEMPAAMNPDGSFEEVDGKIQGGSKAIETLQALRSVKEFIGKLG